MDRVTKLQEMFDNTKRYFEDYEQTCSGILQIIAKFRMTFYSLCFYLICTTFSDEKLYFSFSALFLLFSILQVISDQLFSSLTIRRLFRNLIQSFTVVSSIIMTVFLAHAFKFLFENHDVIWKCIYTLLQSRQSLPRKFVTFFALVCLPLSGILNSVTKYFHYRNMPDYVTNQMKVDFFTGRRYDRKKGAAGVEIPLMQIVTIFVQYVASGNILGCLQSFIEILGLFTTYVGHKKETMLFPTILSVFMSIFLTITSFCNMVKCPLTVLRQKRAEWFV